MKSLNQKTVDTLSEIIEVLSSPYSNANHYVERTALLTVTTQFLELREAYLLVWLLDEGVTGRELRLDQVYVCEQEIGCGFLDDPGDLRGATATLPRRQANANKLHESDVESAISVENANCPILAFLKSRNYSTNEFSQLFYILKPATSLEEQSYPPVGALQVLLKADEEQLAIYGTVFPLMAKAVAGRIETSRHHRIWSAQRELNARASELALATTAIDDEHPIQQILKIAASIVQKNSRANYCVVRYRASPFCDNIYEGKAYGPQGLPEFGHISEPFLTSQLTSNRKPFRVSDICDRKELERTFGVPAPLELFADENQNQIAWMGVPVRTRSIKYKGPKSDWQEGEAIICYIQAFSKTSPGHIYSSFSETDYGLAETVAAALANVLPAIETRLGFQHISDGLADFAKKPSLNEQFIVDTIDNLFPCSEFSAVIDEVGTRCCSKGLDSSILDSNKHKIFQRQKAIISIPLTTGEQMYAFVRRFYNITNHYCSLVVGIENGEMLKYRLDIIQYLCEGASIFLSERYRHEKSLAELVEIRHAVRSGLMGAIGHLHVAHQRYDLFRDKPEDIAYRRIVKSPRLRRSFDRADFFAKKTRVLLDQTRFLLDEISRDQLKITYFDISSLIGEVVSCVTPEAEYKECTVIFTSNIHPQLRYGWADRDALYVLIFNIIENAVKYSFRKQHIRVRCTAVKESWDVAVTNVGLHIPDELRTSIFEPWTRGQLLTNPDSRRPGTGLGLAVCERILKAHDNSKSISFDSTPFGDSSARTEFHIPIPRLGGKEQ